MIISILFFIFLTPASHMYGEQTWQGNAAMIRRGEFETAGFFAASNSFPLNTKILIKNLNNQRTTEVIVLKRLSEYYSVFLLLSEEAAFELGMSEDTVINVEVTVINFGTGDAIGLPDDLPYNPDPDVFPLPTVPEDTTVTPGPTPFPGETPEPESTETMTLEPTDTPAPGETPGPTPETSETPVPESTVEATSEPTLEPTPEPLDAKLDRDPQKNLFLPPREDEMYVLEDFFKPEETGDEETVPDLKVVSTDEYKGEAIDESITIPDQKDKDIEISSFEMKDPEVEDPFLEDKTNPRTITSGINLDDPAIPEIVEKEKPVPDPSNEVPEATTYDIALEPQEPVVPGEITPELSNEMPQPRESDIALDPAEPDITAKEQGVPDPSNEIPDAEEYDIALEPGEPDVPDEEEDIPDPSYEIPDADEIAEIAIEPAEPDTPGDEEKETPDPSYEIPDAEEIMEIAMEPAEPNPPSDEEKETPDPSYEVPETTGETEIALNPEDPEVPIENGKEPDNGDMIPGEDEEIIITFEETGPKPPTDADMIHEKDGKDDIHKEDLEKGKFFIQLAAYTEKSPALALEMQYSSIYPVKVYSITDKMLEIHKVMVGPLNKYESDTLLFRFKSLGFRDAFVKYIN